MARKGFRELYPKEAVGFFNHVINEKPLLPFLIPLIFLAWVVERWIVPFSNWLPLAVAVWVTLQHGRFQQQSLVENLNRKWEQLYLNRLHMTPLEPCEWLNKLLLEVWSNFMEPKISIRISSIVETRLKHKRPKLLERISLQEFNLGSIPPGVGLQGAHWITSGDQRILRIGFDWITNDISILLAATLAKPLAGTARIVVNSLRIKGNLLLTPALDGQAVLYSFEAPPEVKIGVAFGSGGSQGLPATELPGVSTWLVKLLSETLAKIMVEPRRGCYSLPAVDLRKQAVGCVLSVTVVSASKLALSGMCNASVSRQTSGNEQSGGSLIKKNLQTFIEVEIGELTRRTSAAVGSDPRWDNTFNMVLHGTSGILKFNLYECSSNSYKFDYLTSCEIKMKYVADYSTTFWAIGPKSGVIAKQAQYCGKEIVMVVPFEGMDNGELTVKLVLEEWQFSDGSSNLRGSHSARTQQLMHISPSIQIKTGRKIKITVLEARNLAVKYAKSDLYVKLQYGKVLRRTETASHTSDPVWNQTFEFDETSDGGYLRIKCFSTDLFGDESIGSAQINIDGISENPRDAWIPLEKVSRGELRLQIEAVTSEVSEAPKKNGNGWIELVLVEAKELIAADLRGTSDPYVRVQYGNLKKRTKVVYKTLNPQWNQTLEFPDTRSPLILDVRDYNALLPTASIGSCEVEYENLPPNQMADKWIPLQGVKKGEIHIKITRKFPEREKKSSLDNNMSGLTKATQISGQMSELLKKFHALVEDGDLESISMLLNEIENAGYSQEDYMVQLEKEKALLINKINDLAQEIKRTSQGSMNSG